MNLKSKIFFFILFIFQFNIWVNAQSGAPDTADLTEVKALYTELINNPNNHENRFLLVEKLIELNIPSEAQFQLSYLAPNFQSSKRYSELQNEVENLNNADHSENINQNYQSLKADPSNVSAVKKTVFDFFNMKDYSSASEILQEALELNPADADLKYLYAQTLYNLNSKPEAFKVISELVKTGNATSDQKLLYARLAVWLNKDKDNAESILKNLIEEDTEHIYPYLSLSLLNSNNGYLIEADEYFKLAQKIDPDNPELILISQRIFNAEKSGDQSYSIKDTLTSPIIENLKNQLAEDPNNVELRYRIIDEYLLYNQVNEAENQLKYLSPNLEGNIIYDSYTQKIKRMKTRSTDEKINKLIADLKGDPQNLEAVNQLCKLLSSKFRYKEAAEIFEEYLSIQPDDDATRFNYAKTLYYGGDFSEAEAELLILLEKDPSNNEYLILSAQTEIAIDGDLQKAERELKSVLNSDSQNINAVINLALLNSKLKFFDSARYYTEMANKIDPDNPEVMQLNSILKIEESGNKNKASLIQLMNARKYKEEGNCSAAAEEYESYLFANPNSYQILLELADAYNCAGKTVDEIDVLNDLLEIKYSVPIAKREAKLIYEYGEYEIAYQNLKKINALDPSYEEVVMLMGDALLKMGEYKRARAVYSGLLKNTNDPVYVKSRMDEIDSEYKQARHLDGSVNALNKEFFTNVSLIPKADYFNNNERMELISAGGSINFGLTDFISAGLEWSAGAKRLDSLSNSYQSGSGFFKFRPQENLFFKTSLGTRFNKDNKNQPVIAAEIKYGKKDHYHLSLNFIREDAAKYLLSKNLVSQNINVSDISLEGKYILFTTLTFESRYSLTVIPDFVSTQGIGFTDNKRNYFVIRGYKYFLNRLFAGYEYEITDFLNRVDFYYSPQLSDSHSILAGFRFFKSGLVDFILEGKIGYLTRNDKFLKSVKMNLDIIPAESLFFNIHLSLVDTYRYQTRYNYGTVGASVNLRIH